ncbi:cyclophilin-like domain-containing protein [Schizophyllum commune]
MRPRVFLDISVNQHPIGRVIFELFNDTAPRTSENFRALCTGEKGLSHTEHPLYYKNSPLHRIIKDFMIQGGDIVKGNGTGSPESIYGGAFEDEDLERPVDAEGLLCMANKGPDTNGSQYFITLKEAPHLNGKHVVVGRVIRGLDVVQKVAEVEVDAKFRPVVPVVVSNSGELELRRPPPKPTSEESVSDEDSRSRKRKSRRRSPSSGVSSDEDRDRKRKHKSKKSKHRKHRSRTPDAPATSTEPRQETEEEYDARLEREEKERIEARRKEELRRVQEQLKRRQEREASNSAPDGQTGIRFKGRGRMKYTDPEISRR